MANLAPDLAWLLAALARQTLGAGHRALLQRQRHARAQGQGRHATCDGDGDGEETCA